MVGVVVPRTHQLISYQAFLKQRARVARERTRLQEPCPSSSVVQPALITRVRTGKVSRKDQAMSHTEIIGGMILDPALVHRMSGLATANGIVGTANGIGSRAY